MKVDLFEEYIILIEMIFDDQALPYKFVCENRSLKRQEILLQNDPPFLYQLPD